MNVAVITNGYAAKRALIARLQQVSALGQGGLGQAKVTYGWDGNQTDLVSVFGGRVAFVQPGEEDAQDGGDVVVKETATITLHIRAMITPPPEGGLVSVEELLEQIGDEIASEIARDRHLCGGHSFARVADGIGEPEPVDDALAARLSLHIAVDSYLIPT